MKTKLMAAVAVVAIVAAAGVAKADSADELKALKAQSAALKKQNAELEKRLAKIEKQQAKEQAELAKQPAARPAASSFMADLPSLKGPLGCAPLSLEGPLTFCGITLFGTLDAGLGYATHGAPNSGGFYTGDTLMQKYYNHANFGVMPNGLSQTTLGIKGEEELIPGLAGVFYASTGINPQSGQLANAPGSQVANNGIPLTHQSMNADGTRGGQAFNDQLYAGLSSKTFGQLTFGRQKTFSNDLLAVYDPAGAAYDYSPIGFAGTFVAGLGETDLGRLDDTLKYRVEYGPVHFGAMYKFINNNAGVSLAAPTLTANQCGPVGTPCTNHNDGYQFNLGGHYAGFDLDGVYSHFNQALTYGTLGGSLLPGGLAFIGAQGLAGTVADVDSFMVAGRYSWNQFKFYIGYANDRLSNPSDPEGIGANTGQGDYPIITVNNSAFPHDKVLQTIWGGVKYAWNSQTDFTVAYYHINQNDFGTAAQNATCGNPRINMATLTTTRSGNCSGDEDVVSAYVDYHFTKRFDMYGGFMYSTFNGGLAAGSLYTNNFAPTVGARFTF